MDRIVPAIGEHSERRTVRADRLEKIRIGAAKQSLKGAVPELAAPASVRDFLRGPASPLPENGREPGGMQDLRHLKLIAYCGEAEKCSLRQALEQWQEQWQEQWREQTPVPEAGCAQAESSGIPLPRITILIGPEGDFSPQEVDCALAAGYRPVHLGASRLRTETAAVAAVAEVYFFFGNRSPF